MTFEPEPQRRNEPNSPYPLVFFVSISAGVVMAIYFMLINTVGPFAGMVPLDEFRRRCDASAKVYVASLSGTFQDTTYFPTTRRAIGRRNARNDRENQSGIKVSYLDSGGQPREFTGDCRIDRRDGRAIIE